MSAVTGAAPVVGMIWAEANDRVIGAGGTMPWHLPEDLAHFKSVTSGHPVVMGRRTWDSLPARNRPLPGRRNIVVTTDPDWAEAGAERAAGPEAGLALAAAEGPEQIWVLGGGRIYQALLPRADVLAVTEIDLRVAGDTRAPQIGAEFTAAETGEWLTSRTGLRYRVRRYERAAR